MGSQRVAVFIDYENMQRCAKNELGVRSGHFDPWKLGDLLVERRNADARTPPSHLHQVRVYRGLPDARLQKTANAANNAQTLAWITRCPDADHLFIYRRPLRYPKHWPSNRDGSAPQEKGVDVRLAVDLVQMTYQGGYDVAIVCSHDTDLIPALDVVDTVTTNRCHLEVASWHKRQRISYTGKSGQPWCHRLKREDFDRVADNTDYRTVK